MPSTAHPAWQILGTLPGELHNAGQSLTPEEAMPVAVIDSLTVTLKLKI